MSGLDWPGAIEDVRAAATWLKAQVLPARDLYSRNLCKQKNLCILPLLLAYFFGPLLKPALIIIPEMTGMHQGGCDRFLHGRWER
jgi:hypothetical protein